ncbi:MAG: ribonuclease P protein component [Candidatus Buchananbacteria bacterium]|nr:ribonuclease P protein component [Candidatus Buchananbacteria bacterium]
MLEKKQRLTKKKEFEKITQRGKAYYSPILILKILKNDLSYSRFGLIVSNKVSKKASQRNLIKRRIREIIRLNLNRINAGYDILIIVSPKIIAQDKKVLKYQAIEKSLMTAFSKADLI